MRKGQIVLTCSILILGINTLLQGGVDEPKCNLLEGPEFETICKYVSEKNFDAVIEEAKRLKVEGNLDKKQELNVTNCEARAYGEKNLRLLHPKGPSQEINRKEIVMNADNAISLAQKVYDSAEIEYINTKDEDYKDIMSTSLFILGFEFRDKHEFSKAIDCFEKLIRNHPESFDAPYAVGNLFGLYVNSRREQDGMNMLEELARKYPKDAVGKEALFSKAVFLMHRRDYGKSKEAFVEFKNRFPSDKTFGQIDEQINYRDRKIKETENQPSTHFGDKSTSPTNAKRSGGCGCGKGKEQSSEQPSPIKGSCSCGTPRSSD